MHRCVSHKKNKELNKEVLSGFILLANTPTQTFVFVLAKTGKRKYNSLFCYHCGKKSNLKNSWERCSAVCYGYQVVYNSCYLVDLTLDCESHPVFLFFELFLNFKTTAVYLFSSQDLVINSPL